MNNENILFKNADQDNFLLTKQFIFGCLKEQGNWLFRYVVLKSSNIQGLLLITCLTVAWTFSLDLLHFCLCFLLLEFLTFLYVRHMSTNPSNIELIGISSWEEYYARKKEDKVNKFIVAVDQTTNAIVATVEVIVFGTYRKVDLDENDNNGIAKHHISVEIKRLFVASSFRGTGLAQKLMDQVLDFVKEKQQKEVFISKVVLFINALQISARKLFKQNGFELCKQWDLPIFVGLSHTTLCFYEKKIGKPN